MRKELSDIKDIDNYLSGELSPEQIAEFEKRLKEEEDVRNDVAMLKKVITGVDGYGFKKMLKELHQKLFGGIQDTGPK